eukprot:CAMPEP_0177740500 /NCGR_PEP_ID=MMETSP0484_2-20121128/27604_1 /TAXON_ID=354590 /ORGANISM="Rhodomonas lens, Strain RHODO" /LENGTH=38 /DNA_ID= /DNA_START= /DNA_END= /DNA_ORIENTATION=
MEDGASWVQSAHREIQHKKPHGQYDVYQERGFLYLSLP